MHDRCRPQQPPLDCDTDRRQHLSFRAVVTETRPSMESRSQLQGEESGHRARRCNEFLNGEAGVGDQHVIALH